MSKSKISDINSFSLLSPCESDFVLRRILLEMPVSERTISYRRAIYNELRDNTDLCEELYNIFGSMHFYAADRLVKFGDSSTIMELLTRLRDLDA